MINDNRYNKDTLYFNRLYFQSYDYLYIQSVDIWTMPTLGVNQTIMNQFSHEHMHKYYSINLSKLCIYITMELFPLACLF